MSSSSIPDEDRIDVITKLQERLSAAGDRTLREQAELKAAEQAEHPSHGKPELEKKEEGQKEGGEKEVDVFEGPYDDARDGEVTERRAEGPMM